MEWVSIEQRLPPECENVLIYYEGFAVTGAYLVFSENGSPLFWHVNDWDESETIHRLGEVSHWMPLPELPRE